MSLLGYILSASLLSSLLALIGGIFVLWQEKRITRWIWALVAFSAGVLIALAFLGLLPEAIEQGREFGFESNQILFWTIVGFYSFLSLEQFLIWHHSHHEGDEIHPYTHGLVFGDALHNFIDGLAIAAAFLVSIPLGLALTLSVFIHEVPQEISDFSLMLHGGLSKQKVFLYNFLVALSAPIGGLIGFFFRERLDLFIPKILAFTAGMFIYISASDLVPEIVNKSSARTAINLGLLALGIAVFYLMTTIIPEP